jgi:DNA invertase Pin-like site-specific DNA recombinase
VLEARYPRGGRGQQRRAPAAGEAAQPPTPKETGPERWARWAAMVAGGMTKAEVARADGVSRAAVSQGLRKLAAGKGRIDFATLSDK